MATRSSCDRASSFHVVTSLVRGSWTGFCNGRLTSSLRNMIEVAKTDVWSHWITLALDLYGAPCWIVSGFAL